MLNFTEAILNVKTVVGYEGCELLSLVVTVSGYFIGVYFAMTYTCVFWVV